MTRRIAVDHSQLEHLSLAELRETWAACFAEPIPSIHTRHLLALAIGHRLQSARDGGLPRGVKRRLAELERRFRADPHYAPRPTPDLPPGCTIVKDWQGERHEVGVLEKGFSYRGVTFNSLSAVARNITGTPWSGPRFFDLKRRVR